MGLFGEERSFLPQLSPADRATLTSLGATRTFAAHETLLLEGDRSSHLILLLEGWCAVWLATERGGQLILGLRSEGELIGEMAALDGRPRSASVTTLSPTTGLVVPADAFRRFLSARPHATALVLGQLTERLRSADRERRALASLTVVQRLCRALVELAERTGTAQGPTLAISLPLAQHELAATVGCTRDAVAKALRLLRERGLVETGPSVLRVASLEPLRLMAGAEGPG
ncbi:Crp/Fnr family transcriptional regulator [Streptomyces sp. NPDC001661]